jgi:hypothetical protein
MDEEEAGLEVNLCELLGINVEAIAIRLAMGEDVDEENEELEANEILDYSDI